mmetsp:Transcript_10907/g.16270  ORF Transcript_10907/g.16270 Transcript_10907/m.16270 type:complete len:781 (+) Transcript_10907:89-2431(+)
MEKKAVRIWIESEDRKYVEGVIHAFINNVEAKAATYMKAQVLLDLGSKVFTMVFGDVEKDKTEDEDIGRKEAVYALYVELLREYLTNIAAKRLQEADGSSDTEFLTVFQDRYGKYVVLLKIMLRAFSYLNRYYINDHNKDDKKKGKKKIQTLKEKGVELFKHSIFMVYYEKVIQAILRCIQEEREGGNQNHEVLRNSVKVFLDLKLYEEKLEGVIIQRTYEHYNRCGAQWLRVDSSSTYLQKSEKAMNDEIRRVNAYLSSNTEKPMSDCVYEILLKKYQRAILEEKGTGLKYFLEERKDDDLKRICSVFRDKELEFVGKMLQNHIANKGKKIVSMITTNEKKKSSKAIQEDMSEKAVIRLIELHDIYKNIVFKCFGKHQIFQKALREGFVTFINDSKAAESIAKTLAQYSHLVLLKGSKYSRMSNEEKILENVAFVYGYIHDKDIFDIRYQLFLQYRLLQRKSVSESFERRMLAGLSAESGKTAMSTKLEGMYNDVKVSKEHNDQFIKNYDVEKSAGLEKFNVTVMTQGFWPDTSSSRTKIPNELKEVTSAFNVYYANKFTERKLRWKLEMGEAQIEIKFIQTMGGKRREKRRRIIVSSIQLMILLCFNRNEVMKFRDLLYATGLENSSTLQNHLVSLAHPKNGKRKDAKFGVLMMRPKPKPKKKLVLTDNHEFKINPNFYPSSSKPARMEIIQFVQNVESKIDEGILRQRQQLIDVSIVRTMKMNKQMRHMPLVKKVTAGLKAYFKVDPGMVKKRIESLMDQEYLERDLNDRGLYNYLA